MHNNSIADFNPHSHEGSDFLTSALPLVLAISTHTPTKGATLASHGCNIYDSRFQPTLPRRERHKCLCESSYIIRFQPTLPRRERQLIASIKELQLNFNPHSHEGSDQTTINTAGKIFNFNPHSHEGSDNL